MAFSRDGARLTSASHDGTVRLWDVQRATEIAVLLRLSSGDSSVRLSQDGTRFTSTAAGRMVRVWHSQTGAEMATLWSPNSVAMSWDATRFTSMDGNAVRMWDGDTGAEMPQLRGHSNYVELLKISPTGRRLVSTSYDGAMRQWDTQTVGAVEGTRNQSAL